MKPFLSSAFFLLIALFTHAQNPGDLDSTFNSDGIVTTDFNGESDEARSTVIQPDGKILVAGNSGGGIALARYNNDGSLDNTFDTDGMLTTDVNPDYGDVTSSMALQADGKIVVAGYSGSWTELAFFVVRYNIDGSLDSSFAEDGKIPSNDYVFFYNPVNAVAIQPDGKIVVAGAYSSSFYWYTPDFFLARYNIDGTADSNFNNGGAVITSIGGHAEAYSMILQPDAKIVVAGFAWSADVFCLARYNSSGTLDSSFGTNGIVTTDFGSDADGAYSIALQTDGKIVAAGIANFTDSNDFGLARYNTNGTLDTSFSTDGKLTTDLEAFERANAVALQSDGKIVVAGSSWVNPNYDFTLIRYESDGSLDSSFNIDGVVTTDLNSNDHLNSLVIQADGKILVAGGSNEDFTLVRYFGGNEVGINDFPFANNSVLIYPSPTTGSFTVKISSATNANSKAILIITDLLGRKMFQQESSITHGKLNEEILLNKQFTEGLYFVRIKVNDAFFTQPLIVQR